MRVACCAPSYVTLDQVKHHHFGAVADVSVLGEVMFKGGTEGVTLWHFRGVRTCLLGLTLCLCGIFLLAYLLDPLGKGPGSLFGHTAWAQAARAHMLQNFSPEVVVARHVLPLLREAYGPTDSGPGGVRVGSWVGCCGFPGFKGLGWRGGRTGGGGRRAGNEEETEESQRFMMKPQELKDQSDLWMKEVLADVLV